MTYFYYKTNTWSNEPQVSKETKNLWKEYAEKSNWRITQLPNGFYQTEFNNDDNWQGVTRRETIEGAEKAIDSPCHATESPWERWLASRAKSSASPSCLEPAAPR